MDSDEWSVRGLRITDEPVLARIRNTLENEAPLVLEHWHYRGARAPSRLVFDAFEDFEEYITKAGRPGDAFYVWNFSACCTDDNVFAEGKFPDAEGRVPKTGVY